MSFTTGQHRLTGELRTRTKKTYKFVIFDDLSVLLLKAQDLRRIAQCQLVNICRRFEGS